MKLWHTISSKIFDRSHSQGYSARRPGHDGRQAFSLEALESRVLLSADLAGTLILPASQQTFSVADLLVRDASSFAIVAQQSTSSAIGSGELTQEPANTAGSVAVNGKEPVSGTGGTGVGTVGTSGDDLEPQPVDGAAPPTRTTDTQVDDFRGSVNTSQSSPRTYFISPGGDDTNDGSSPTLALKTLSAVSELQLVPGDVIALEGGASFTGKLVIHNSGLDNQPIQVTSFATPAGDRAEILAGEGDGIVLRNVERILISNLKITGAGATANSGQGIMLLHDDANDRRLLGIQIDQVEASGFRYAGIAMYTQGALRYGYEDIRVTHADVHDNGYAGMWMGSAPGNYPDHPETYAYENVYVGYSRFYDNHGVNIEEQTGNGLFFKDVNGGVIEHCLAYNNGSLNRTPNGPVGIWAIYSNNVVIQFNESFGNRTQGGDGNGFDLDGGTTNSVMQYNYSHDNAGPGFLVYQFNDVYRASSTGNVVRYNISENDSRQGAETGAIDIRAQNSPELDTQVYGNTVYLDNGGLNSVNISAIRTSGNLSHVRVFNNLFMTTGGVRLVDTQGPLEVALFQGNRYSSDGDPFIISSGGVMYGSVEEWRAASHQELDGVRTG
jgi:Right handed beta helix region